MTGGFFLFIELSPEQNSGDLLLRISLFRLRRFSGISNELKVDEPAVDVHADALHANLVANSIYAAVDRSGEDNAVLYLVVAHGHGRSRHHTLDGVRQYDVHDISLSPNYWQRFQEPVSIRKPLLQLHK